MIVSCHQPNYLPYLGYFDKIKNCDIFVLFDDVQLPQSNKDNFETKNKIKTSNGVLELNVPILKRGDRIFIKDALIYDNGWRKKHLRSIVFAYKKAPFFNQYIGQIEKIYKTHWEKLYELNTTLIILFNRFFGIKTKLIFSSELELEDLYGEEKILAIIKKLGGDTYISGRGIGSLRYIKKEDFKKENIKLIWQDFKCPTYHQLWGEFVPNLSAIDYLMCEGGTMNNANI